LCGMDSRLKRAGMTDDEKCRFQTNSSIVLNNQRNYSILNLINGNSSVVLQGGKLHGNNI